MVRHSEEKVPGNAERGGEFGFEAGRGVHSARGGGNSKAREGGGDEEKGDDGHEDEVGNRDDPRGDLGIG